MIQLYHSPLSRSKRVLWLLEELGLEYQLERVALAELDKPEYRALNPFARVPVLKDGDLVLFESGAIVEYLIESYGGAHLIPAGGPERALCRQWMHYAEATLTPPLSNIAQHSFLLPEEQRIPAVVSAARAKVASQLASLDLVIGERDYICGSEFSAADIMLGYSLGLAKLFALVDDSTPHVVAYLARLEARPAFQKASA